MKNRIYVSAKTLTVLISSLLLVACGSKKEEKSSGEPRGTTPLGSVNSPQAECTRVAQNNMFFTGEIATFYSGGRLIQDYLQLNIRSLPAEFYSDDHYIQLYRWNEPTSGNRNDNTLPVRMYLVNKLTGALASQTPTERLSRSLFETYIEDNGLDTFDVTPNNFLNNYYVLMTEMEYQWEAVTISIFSDTTGSIPLANAEALLPPFFADPTVYVSRVPVPNLQRLHPFYNLQASGASATEFARRADEICASFFGTVRNTASIDDVEGGGPLSFFSKAWNWFLSLFS